MKRWPGLVLAACAAALFTGTAAADALFPKKGQPDFLPVDQAFELQPLERRDGKLLVAWRIAKDYYLYRDRLKFTLAQPGGATLGVPVLPAGETHTDEYFGEVEVYRGTLRAALPYAGTGPVKISVAYQGCADKGLCYPIQTRSLELSGP